MVFVCSVSVSVSVVGVEVVVNKKTRGFFNILLIEFLDF